MKAGTGVLISIFLLFLFTACIPAYRVPYLSLDLKNEPYTVSDITINYTYVCEEQDQRCVYSLYNVSNPSEILYEDDSILPSTGVLIFNDLAEGDYRLIFSIYSEKDGEYSLLKFLDESYNFSIDLP